MIYQSGRITKNKSWELQIANMADTIFNLTISWTHKCDHAGFRFNLEIYKFMFEFNLYDNRHWDYDNNDYEKYD